MFLSVPLGSLLRYGIYILAPSPIWILTAQVLHCFAFAVFYILGARLVAAEAPPSMRNSYQTLWASLVIGLGGFVGGMISGLLAGWVAIENVYWLSVGAVLVSLVPLLYFLINKPLDAKKMIGSDLNE